MNPARNFGPAIYNLNFKSHWVYWAAPISSALITSITFKSLFYQGEEKKQPKTPEAMPLRNVKSEF